MRAPAEPFHYSVIDYWLSDVCCHPNYNVVAQAWSLIHAPIQSMSTPTNHDFDDLFASWHTDLDIRLQFTLPPISISNPVRPPLAKIRQDLKASSTCSIDELSIGEEGVQAQ